MYDARETRRRLMAAAEETLRDVGWDAASGSRITKRAGVSNGSLFHAFPGGKIELAVELFLRWHAELWDQAIKDVCANPRPGPRHLDEPYRLLIQGMEHDRETARLYFLLHDALLRHPLASAVRDRLNQDESQVRMWMQKAAPDRCPPSPLCFPLVFGGIVGVARAWAEASESTSMGGALNTLAASFKPFDTVSSGRRLSKPISVNGELSL